MASVDPMNAFHGAKEGLAPRTQPESTKKRIMWKEYIHLYCSPAAGFFRYMTCSTKWP